MLTTINAYIGWSTPKIQIRYRKFKLMGNDSYNLKEHLLAIIVLRLCLLNGSRGYISNGSSVQFSFRWFVRAFQVGTGPPRPSQEKL